MESQNTEFRPLVVGALFAGVTLALAVPLAVLGAILALFAGAQAPLDVLGVTVSKTALSAVMVTLFVVAAYVAARASRGCFRYVSQPVELDGKRLLIVVIVLATIALGCGVAMAEVLQSAFGDYPSR